jgi:flagellar assembly factor FliW
MVIQTRDYGLVEIDEREIIHFPRGIYGFEETKRFVLLKDKSKEDNPFMWLQNVDGPKPCFVVAQPRELFPDYAPDITVEAVQEIPLESADDLRLLALVTVPSEIVEMSFNLRCPIVINAKENIAVQTILENEQYSLSQPYFRKGD